MIFQASPTKEKYYINSFFSVKKYIFACLTLKFTQWPWKLSFFIKIVTEMDYSVKMTSKRRNYTYMYSAYVHIFDLRIDFYMIFDLKLSLHGTSNHHSNSLNVPVNIPWKIGITHFTSFICSNLYFQIHLLTMKMTLNNQNSFRNGLSSQNHCTCRGHWSHLITRGRPGPLWSGDQRGGSGRVTLIRWWFDIATLTVDYRIHVSCSLRNYPADTCTFARSCFGVSPAS